MTQSRLRFAEPSARWAVRLWIAARAAMTLAAIVRRGDDSGTVGGTDHGTAETQ